MAVSDLDLCKGELWLVGNEHIVSSDWKKVSQSGLWLEEKEHKGSFF